jgi:hypothetical protein
VTAADSIFFCKCICFQQYVIVPLYRPANPKQPCLSCTKQFCLDQKLDICKTATLPDIDPDVGTGEEGDVQTRCFQRDSTMAKSAVISFILLTSALVCAAAVKERVPQWLQDRLPTRQTEALQAGWTRVFGAVSSGFHNRLP